MELSGGKGLSFVTEEKNQLSPARGFTLMDPVPPVYSVSTSGMYPVCFTGCVPREVCCVPTEVVGAAKGCAQSRERDFWPDALCSRLLLAERRFCC